MREAERHSVKAGSTAPEMQQTINLSEELLVHVQSECISACYRCRFSSQACRRVAVRRVAFHCVAVLAPGTRFAGTTPLQANTTQQ